MLFNLNFKIPRDSSQTLPLFCLKIKILLSNWLNVSLKKKFSIIIWTIYLVINKTQQDAIVSCNHHKQKTRKILIKLNLFQMKTENWKFKLPPFQASRIKLKDSNNKIKIWEIKTVYFQDFRTPSRMLKPNFRIETLFSLKFLNCKVKTKAQRTNVRAKWNPYKVRLNRTWKT